MVGSTQVNAGTQMDSKTASFSKENIACVKPLGKVFKNLDSENFERDSKRASVNGYTSNDSKPVPQPFREPQQNTDAGDSPPAKITAVAIE